MNFLVEGLRIFQKNLGDHFRTLETPQYPWLYLTKELQNQPCS